MRFKSHSPILGAQGVPRENEQPAQTPCAGSLEAWGLMQLHRLKIVTVKGTLSNILVSTKTFSQNSAKNSWMWNS